MDVTYSELRPLNVPEVTKLHVNELMDGVLYLIGDASLNTMYAKLLESGNSIVAAYIENKVIAYVTIIKTKPSILRIINLTGWISLLIRLMVNPKLVYKIYETLLFDKSSYKAVLSYCKDSKVMELSHFVVAKPYQSKGIGKKLIRIVEEISKLSKCEYIYTTTHNQNLSKYYVNNNMARVIYSRLIGGKLHQCLIWKCR